MFLLIKENFLANGISLSRMMQFLNCTNGFYPPLSFFRRSEIIYVMLNIIPQTYTGWIKIAKKWTFRALSSFHWKRKKNKGLSLFVFNNSGTSSIEGIKILFRLILFQWLTFFLSLFYFSKLLKRIFLCQIGSIKRIRDVYIVGCQPFSLLIYLFSNIRFNVKLSCVSFRWDILIQFFVISKSFPF